MPDNLAPDFAYPDKDLVALNMFYDFCLVRAFTYTTYGSVEEEHFLTERKTRPQYQSHKSNSVTITKRFH